MDCIKFAPRFSLAFQKWKMSPKTTFFSAYLQWSDDDDVYTYEKVSEY